MQNEYKDVELGKRKWRVRKFDARTGSFMLFKVMGILAPAFKQLDPKVLKEAKVEDLNLTELISGLTSLSEKDFNYIQDKCLGVSHELLAAGEVKVLNENGTYGVSNIEFDTSLVLGLTVHALMFNVAGFFGENPLGSITGGMLASFLQGAKT